MEAAPEPAIADLDDIVAPLVGRIREVLQVDTASIAVLDAAGARFRMTRHAGAHSADYQGLSIAPGAGLGGLAARTDGPVVVADYLTSPTITDDYRGAVADEGLRGMVCVPVLGPDGALLLLYAGNRAVGNLGDRLLGRLEGLAADVEEDLRGGRAGALLRTARESERRRLASELHESVAQVLFAIAMRAGTALENDPASSEPLADIAAMAREGRQDLRRTFVALSSATHTEHPRPDDLATDVGIHADRLGVELTWIHRDLPPTLPAELAQLLLDCAREGMANAAKYGEPAVVLTLSARRGRIRLSVQSPAGPRSVAPEELPPGSGLWILRERVQRAGGTLTLTIDDEAAPTAVLAVDLPAALLNSEDMNEPPA